jgi:hypothetical protein
MSSACGIIIERKNILLSLNDLIKPFVASKKIRFLSYHENIK